MVNIRLGALAVALFTGCSEQGTPALVADARPTPCQALRRCCPVVSDNPEFIPGCEMTAQGGDQSRCQFRLDHETHDPFVRCLADSDRGACAEMKRCCASLRTDQARRQCESTSSTALDTQCAEQLPGFVLCRRDH